MDTTKTLGPAGPIGPRETQQIDTRQAIQRHDPEFERKKNKKQNQDDNGDDVITISIEALIDFLEKLSNIKPANKQNDLYSGENLDEAPDETIAPARPSHCATPAARAASAYGHTAQTMQQKSAILLETTDMASTGAPEMDLSSTDLRTINAMLRDLKALSKTSITLLEIEKAPTFLQALLNAIAVAKTQASL